MNVFSADLTALFFKVWWMSMRFPALLSLYIVFQKHCVGLWACAVTMTIILSFYWVCRYVLIFCSGFQSSPTHFSFDTHYFSFRIVDLWKGVQVWLIIEIVSLSLSCAPTCATAFLGCHWRVSPVVTGKASCTIVVQERKANCKHLWWSEALDVDKWLPNDFQMTNDPQPLYSSTAFSTDEVMTWCA